MCFTHAVQDRCVLQGGYQSPPVPGYAMKKAAQKWICDMASTVVLVIVAALVR